MNEISKVVNSILSIGSTIMKKQLTIIIIISVLFVIVLWWFIKTI